VSAQATHQPAAIDGRPEPIEARGHIHVSLGDCDYCGACVSICPPDCISISERTLDVDPETCTVCKLCIWVCPPGALSLARD
jgi:ferredoxin